MREISSSVHWNISKVPTNQSEAFDKTILQSFSFQNVSYLSASLLNWNLEEILDMGQTDDISVTEAQDSLDLDDETAPEYEKLTIL